MAKRDWARDWELCMRATFGRWQVNGDAYTWDGELNKYASSWVETPTGTWRQYKLNPTGSAMIQQEADARFIAEAREALPYWLQRVRELEKENQRFKRAVASAKQMVAFIHAAVNQGICCNFGLCAAVADLEKGDDNEDA